jgi:hypothetical protein
MPAKDLLTAIEVESAKPGRNPAKPSCGDCNSPEFETIPVGKDYSLSDGAGLHLIVTSSGCKWWHFRYRFNGKPKKSRLAFFLT